MRHGSHHENKRIGPFLCLVYSHFLGLQNRLICLSRLQHSYLANRQSKCIMSHQRNGFLADSDDDCEMYALVFWGPNEDAFFNCIDVKIIPKHLLDGKRSGYILARGFSQNKACGKPMPFKGQVFTTNGNL